MPSAWIAHVKSVYAKGKSKGMSFKQAMISAKASYRKGKSSKAEEKEPETKPKRRRAKKKKLKQDPEE